MDPNLRTLSLSAWMSLPGLDFGTWESLNAADQISDNKIIQTRSKPFSNNSKKSKSSRNSCRKCEELNETNSNHVLESNNNTEGRSLACSCSEISPSLNFRDNNLKEDESTSKLTKRNSAATHQVIRETQSRALVSKVAKYYESYVTQMNLQKYFMNDVVVTRIVPIHLKDPKCNAARWIVFG